MCFLVGNGGRREGEGRLRGRENLPGTRRIDEGTGEPGGRRKRNNRGVHLPYDGSPKKYYMTEEKHFWGIQV